MKTGHDIIDVVYDTDVVVYCIDDFVYVFMKTGHDIIDVVYDTDVVVYNKMVPGKLFNNFFCMVGRGDGDE
jgi:hypothetical protein